ncbi:MAG: hypothetical protein IPI98_14750 [Chitinophagaceae bacterium]|nr:hypothetical protein [Chitinophagaceae bacterium]
MKKIFYFLMLCSITIPALAQQNDKYTAAMQKHLAGLDSAFNNPEAMLALANSFNRMGEAEKTQWLPLLLCCLLPGKLWLYAVGKNKDLVDDIAAKATEYLNKADAMNAKNSEISCVKSMIATSIFLVNPMVRYNEYGAISQQYLEEAKMQDTTNPRPYFLIGQGLRYTPEQFGGGCSAALPILAEAAKNMKLLLLLQQLIPIGAKR